MSRAHENHEPDELAPAEQAAIERSLAAVAPAPPRVDRDRLMFLAGQASALSDSRPPIPDLRLPTLRTWLWPATSAALGATSLALAVALLVRPAPQVQVVYHDRPVPFPAIAPQSPLPASPPTPLLVAAAATRTPPSDLSSHNYLRTRDVALRLGLDALGTFSGGGGGGTPAPTYRSLLESLSPARSQAPIASPESSQM
jgi:hypothetical protein